MRGIIAAVATTLTLSAPVRAQPDEAPSNPEPAERLIDEGVELRREGREREALKRFRKAHELDPASPRALAQMGLAEKSLRDYLRAEAHLAAALEHADHPWIERNREPLEQARELVAKQLGWLKIATNVPGAELRLNGDPADAPSPGTPHRVVAGRVLVALRAEGYVTTERTVSVPAGETTELTLELQRVPPPAPDPPADPAPVDGPDPDEARSPDTWITPWTPWIIGTGALGVVGVVVGAGLGVRVLQLKSERDDLCPEVQCSDMRGIALDEEARSLAIGSTVGFVVGGVAAVTALVLWLVEPEDSAVSATVSTTGGVVGSRF